MKFNFMKNSDLILWFAIVLAIFYYFPTIITLFSVFLVYIIFLLKDIRVGLLLLIFILAFEKIIQEHISFSLYGLNVLIIFILLFLIRYIIAVLIKETILYNHKITICFIYSFLAINIFSLLLNFINIPLVASYYGMLIVSMMLLYFFIIFSIESRKFFDMYLYTILVVSLLLSVLVMPDIPQILSGNNSRLKFAGSLRTLTSFVAPAVIIGIYLLTSSKARGENLIKLLKSKIFLLLTVCLGISVLLLTGSRGTIYALLLSVLILFLLNLKISTRKLVVSFFIGLILIANIDLNKLPNPVERLFNTDSDIRTEIWANAFNQLNAQEFIFGRGLNRFQELSLAGGYVAKYTGEPWYAHSVYIDILFSGGIFALCLLIIYIISLLYSSIKNQSRLSTVLLFYFLIAYFTHGESISTIFWISLALVMGASKWYINDIAILFKKKEIVLHEKNIINK